MILSKRILAGAALLAAFTAPATPAPAQTPNTKAAAVVNGEPIGWGEVEAVMRSGMPPSTQPLTAEQRREMQANAVNILVEDMLMRQYLRKNAPPVPPTEVEKEMQDLKAALAKEKQTVESFLKDTQQTEAQLRADLAARLQWKTFINPRLTEQNVKAYYDANKLFFDKVLVRASHILLRVAPTASQQDRQMVYNRIVAIRKEVLEGKLQFADAAKKFSDCPSKDNGGDIGVFPYKFAVLEPFAKAAFAMKVGDVSEVVATDFGYHVIKVTDRSAGQPSNYEQIKNEVKEVYAQDIYQMIIAEQRRTAKIETQ